MINWCLEIYDKITEEYRVPTTRSKTNASFILKASNKWKIIDGILEWDNLLFIKCEDFEYYKYNLVKKDWVFELIFPVKTAEDYLKYNKWVLIDESYEPIAYYDAMFRIYK